MIDQDLVTWVLTTALETASPSPALLMEPWEPPLKARNPKSRMRNPRQTKGIEWPGIPPLFFHLSVLDRDAVYESKRIRRLNLAPRMTQPGKERTAPAR